MPKGANEIEKTGQAETEPPHRLKALARLGGLVSAS
jgi:hypothetical protein